MSIACVIALVLGLSEVPAKPTPFVERIPGSTAVLTMVPIPRGDDPAAFWMASTETTWDAYDAFVLEDTSAPLPPGVDALARPSRPYLTADRGFGRDGYPALSVSLAGAQAFCDWLSAHTGRRWRLPTEAEWQHAALAGGAGPWHAAEDYDGVAPAGAAKIAWCEPHAQRRTRPVGTLAANAFGLHDVHGNVAEWVIDADGRGLLAGGSYRDPLSATTAFARRRPDATWNASDPNLPKSRWWLADAPFAGFRVVCEAPPPVQTSAP